MSEKDILTRIAIHYIDHNTTGKYPQWSDLVSFHYYHNEVKKTHFEKAQKKGMEYLMNCDQSDCKHDDCGGNIDYNWSDYTDSIINHLDRLGYKQVKFIEYKDEVN